MSPRVVGGAGVCTLTMSASVLVIKIAGPQMSGQGVRRRWRTVSLNINIVPKAILFPNGSGFERGQLEGSISPTLADFPKGKQDQI